MIGHRRRRRRSGHLHSESLARPLVDVVGDGDGGRDLAEVGDDAAVQTRDALVAQDVPGEDNG